MILDNMIPKEPDTQANKFFHINKNNVTFRKLVSQFLFGGHLKDSDLVYHNIPEEKENKYLHRSIIYLSLVLQALLNLISTPLRILGYLLEAILNLFKGSCCLI